MSIVAKRHRRNRVQEPGTTLRLVIALIALTAWPTETVVNAVQRGRAVDASFENGRYRHAGIAFEVPSAWTYEGTVAGNNPFDPFDQTAHWVDPQSGIAFYAYLNTQKTAPENIAALVRDSVAEKTKQREREPYQKWHVPRGEQIVRPRPFRLRRR